MRVGFTENKTALVSQRRRQTTKSYYETYTFIESYLLHRAQTKKMSKNMATMLAMEITQLSILFHGSSSGSKGTYMCISSRVLYI